MFELKHILSSSQFNPKNLQIIFERAKEMELLVRTKGIGSSLNNKLLATLFYEPSTRTRLSHEAAMRRLGGKVISTENAREFSSAAKGETIEDTIRVVQGYADAVVMRHYERGAAERAAKVSRVPIINAGDGPGEHPTQGLLDMYTIQKEFGSFDGLSVAFIGDLHNGRTVRSLAQLLSHYKVTIFFVSPDGLRMRDDIKTLLVKKGVKIIETEALQDVLRIADVFYMTRIQKERFATEEDYLKHKGCYVLDEKLVALMKKNAIILHPLPRVDEIDPAVDSDSRAKYFEQAENGLYVRMALLDLLLNK